MEQKDYRLAAIMYTDIAGFSRMMERDEAGTLELLRYHNDLIGGIVARHHGTIIKTIGDALLIDFKNTVEALQSAMETQDRLYEHNRENPGLPLLVRIGVHLGDIYFYENDALGEGINIAARLQSLARPGCICFSQDVYNLVLNKIEFRAEKLGKVSLKNITKEIHAYEITTPNVEFDPDKDRPRPGYKPGSYLDAQAESAIPVGGMTSSTGPLSSRTPPSAPLSEIRKAILQDIKAMGRRMSVDEALERYSLYGVEAKEVIAAMAEQGLLVRRPRAPTPPEPPRAPVFGSGFGSGFGSDSSGQFDPNAIKQNIQAAVHGIVSEIERSVERNMSSEDRERYAEKFGRHAERYRERMERHSQREGGRPESMAESRDAEDTGTERWDKKGWQPGPEELSRDFSGYKKTLETQSRKQRSGLVGNLTSFLAVNGFLWFLNLSTSASFLWAAIVSAGWGIGVVSSAVAAGRASKKLREIDTMPDLGPEQLADYKKLNRVKDAMALHGASTVMVPLLLAVINILTGPSFLWFLIPTAAMLVGYFSHLASFSVTKPRLERKIMESLGVKGGWKNVFRQNKARRDDAIGLGPYADLYREAQNAKDAIEGQLKTGSAGPVDADLAPTLEQYLGQVRLLAQSANEIDRLVESIPMADLSKDRASLVAKEAIASEALKAEYRTSIEEIDRQERSYRELRDQSEVVRLRLGSSVNQLKQMRLDIARVQASPGLEGAGGIEGLRRRTDELSHYLEDLRSGYAESRNDPFAELEEAERKRLEAEAKAKELEGPGPKA